MLNKSTFFLAAFAAVFAACGSDDGPGGPGGGAPPLTIAEFYKARAVLGCTRSFECCATSSSDAQLANNNQQGANSPEECEGAPMHQSWTTAQQNVEAAAEDGTLVFNGTKAAECLAATAQLTCRQFFNDEGQADPKPCDDMLEGQVAQGETCEIGGQCADDLGCIGSISAGSTCRTIPGPGDPCTGYCPYGYFCDTTNTCVESLPEGAGCDPSEFFQCQGICDINTSTCGPPLVFTPACVG